MQHRHRARGSIHTIVPYLNILLADAEVYWADERESRAGYCRWRERCIVLAPWLWQVRPWVLKSVLAHELAHALVGPSQERARQWQTMVYGDELARAAELDLI